MPFADIFSGPPASRTRSTAARHRASHRPTSWYGAAAAAAAHRESVPAAGNPFRRSRRPQSTAPSQTYRMYAAASDASSAAQQQQQQHPPPSSSSAAAAALTPGADADVLVRGVALSIAGVALAVVFLNVALHVALIASALIVPAWRTFKAVEAGPHSAATVVEIVDDDDDDDVVVEADDEDDAYDDDDDDDDDDDVDYRPGYDGAQSDDDVAGGGARAAPGRTGPPRAQGAARTGGDATVWQKYWAMAGLLFGAHALVLRQALGVLLPGVVYRAGALLLFVWLNGNGGGNAASAYEGVVRPLLLKSEAAVDAAAAGVTDRLDAAVRHALCGVQSVIAPYVRQLEAAAQSSRARMEETERARVAARGYFD